ncbi:hypothetical protein [Cellulophaga baltica]|uniref:hypothetical protein n=1 Tax=Cellulophaga baltica TaxID=76594 RepID=UPI000419A120|nr:hypothetical protein [Cellulophaga baltica]AIY14000.1 hypothetical protein M667_12725 [Cellulophaga baltica NN016038]
MNKLDGTWLMIKDADTYCYPEFIEFENDEIQHYNLVHEAENGLLKKVKLLTESLSKSKHKLLEENRFRLFRMGKTLTVISDTESISEDTEFATDYQRIEPTKTNLTENEIQKLEFKAEWNGEKIPIIFNKNMDSPTIQKVNKRLKKEGQKMMLENLQGTYFASIYGDGQRRTLIGFKEIDNDKAVLFGFPEKPYEVIAIPAEKKH